MLGVRNKFTKAIYIAKVDTITEDDDGNEIVTYEEPVLYNFNYQPLSGDSEIAEFGQSSRQIQKCVVPNTQAMKDLFSKFDVVYLDGVTPTTEEVYGQLATHRIIDVRPIYQSLHIYFELINKK